MSDDDHAGVSPLPRKKGPIKPRSPHYQGNNKGGYGNPPIRGQFKGKAGPGRPLGPASLEAAMREVLKGDVPLKNGGTTSYRKALAIAARDASLKKTAQASEFGFSLFERFGPREKPEQGDTADWSTLNEAELVILSSFFNRALRLPPEELTPNPLRLNPETGEGLFRAVKGMDGHLHLEPISDFAGDSEKEPDAALD